MVCLFFSVNLVAEVYIWQEALEGAVGHRRHSAQVVGCAETDSSVPKGDNIARLIVFDIRMLYQLLKFHCINIYLIYCNGVERQLMLYVCQQLWREAVDL